MRCSTCNGKIKKNQNRKGVCNRCYQAKWMREHYDLEKRRDWRQRNAARLMLLGAKNSGRECTISLDDIVIPEFCPVLGIRLMTKCMKRGTTSLDAAPSLDRRDNSRGYVPGNVFVISQRANRLKSDASPEELRRLWMYVSISE